MMAHGEGARRQQKRKNQTKLIKRTIKFLASGPDTDVVRATLEKAPVGVIRGVCNAAVNASQGEVQISAHLKPLFREHSDLIDILTDRQQPLEFKRQLLISSGGGVADGGKRQKGGALPIVVPLLATVLGSLGGEFISLILRRNNDGDQ